MVHWPPPPPSLPPPPPSATPPPPHCPADRRRTRTLTQNPEPDQPQRILGEKEHLNPELDPDVLVLILILQKQFKVFLGSDKDDRTGFRGRTVDTRRPGSGVRWIVFAVFAGKPKFDDRALIPIKDSRMFGGSSHAAQPHMERYGRLLLLLLLGLLLRVCSSLTPDDRLISDRYAVYWNSTNPRSSESTPVRLLYRQQRSSASVCLSSFVRRRSSVTVFSEVLGAVENSHSGPHN
ncbi:ephrin-A2-like [Xyrichtys novacula]|uniref:Ephrin-A2-like n=1 Tax=Xyrichtys novacula TaxID=13765 RepID=A0AAV1FFK2_XYRNO|nr:ephrin-A2-like [Xyrichtys novacula]